MHLDVFKADGFSVSSLTDAINKIPFVPGLLAPLFVDRRVSTLTISVEEKNGVLTLVPPTPRGTQSPPVEKGKRSLRPISIPHFERPDAVYADEVQGIRAFGSETELETLQSKIAERMQIHSQDFEATAEYSRIGAIKGIVSYADGTSLNLFSTFDVSQETEIAFDLSAASPAAGVLRKKCDGVHRLIAKNLGGTPFSGVRAEVGDDFWDDLIAHKEVRETYLNQQEASQLREGTAYQEFNFGGIIWRNYRGAAVINGSETAFVETAKAHFYPTGVNGLFTQTYGPADYIETVNTLGQRLYMKQFPMPNDKGVNLEVQMNALHLCTRPKVLIKGKRGS